MYTVKLAFSILTFGDELNQYHFLFCYRRILIVDWDVHHGQATQQMFYDDPR